MLEILDIEQGTPEWYEARRGLPTASCAGKILAKGGATRQRYMLELTAEIVTGQPTETYVSRDMQRGKDLEPEVRDLYTFLHDVEVEQVGFIKDCELNFGYSPDGLIGTHGLLEIKTRLPHLQVEILCDGGVPMEYRAQMQSGLWITRREWCDLACYCPGMPLHVAREYADKEYFALLEREVGRFNTELAAMVERVQRRAA